MYKDFDTMFSKVINRFTDWELYEDDEIQMACQALKVMANSGQLINLSVEKNM